nr:hypothetical protein [Thermoproteota archaeon]
VLDFDVIDNWNNELDNMNEGKEGASYVYPDSFVQLLGYMRAYWSLRFEKFIQNIFRCFKVKKLGIRNIK